MINLLALNLTYGIAIGVGILLVICFIVWFCSRTPDNLSGYYNTPVIIFGVVIILALIGAVIWWLV